MNDRKLLTIEQLAEILQVPKSWIYRKTSTGDIPHLKLGRYVRFDLEQIEAWLNEKQAGHEHNSLYL